MTCGVQLAICRGGGGHARQILNFPAEGYAARQIEETLSMVQPIDVVIKGQKHNRIRINKDYGL